MSAFICPFCQKEVMVSPGPWQFLYSQVLVHIGHCVVRDTAYDAEDLLAVAAQIADALFEEGGGE